MFTVKEGFYNNLNCLHSHIWVYDLKLPRHGGFEEAIHHPPLVPRIIQ